MACALGGEILRDTQGVKPRAEFGEQVRHSRSKDFEEPYLGEKNPLQDLCRGKNSEVKER